MPYSTRRWQLSPTQMKCTYLTNDSTYILYGFLIKLRYVWGPVLCLLKISFLIRYFGSEKDILNGPNAKSIALSVPTRPQKAWWNIGFPLLCVGTPTSKHPHTQHTYIKSSISTCTFGLTESVMDVQGIRKLGPLDQGTCCVL